MQNAAPTHVALRRRRIAKCCYCAAVGFAAPVATDSLRLGSLEGVARCVRDLGGGTKCVSLAGEGPAGVVVVGVVVQPVTIMRDRAIRDSAIRIRLSFGCCAGRWRGSLYCILEQILSIQSQFCFLDGETVHAEGGEADAFPSSDAA
jgi:hypothetical protein